MTDAACTIALAAFFTFGCALIHGLRGHAQAVTAVLALVAVYFTSVVLLVAVAETPERGGDAVVRTAAREAR